MAADYLLRPESLELDRVGARFGDDVGWHINVYVRYQKMLSVSVV